jgi:hypothetical protein
LVFAASIYAYHQGMMWNINSLKTFVDVQIIGVVVSCGELVRSFNSWGFGCYCHLIVWDMLIGFLRTLYEVIS